MGYFLILFGSNVVLIGVGTLLCGAGFFMEIPLFMSYVSYELPPSRIPFGISFVLAGGQVGLFLAGYWIVIAFALCSGIFGTDVECTFFTAAVVFLIIAVITAVMDPRPEKLGQDRKK